MHNIKVSLTGMRYTIPFVEEATHSGRRRIVVQGIGAVFDKGIVTYLLRRQNTRHCRQQQKQG